MRWIVSIFAISLFVGYVLPSAACTPDYKGKEGGDDGWGGSCGYCGSGQVCDQGKCRACRPGCPMAAECGADECGHPCGDMSCDPGYCLQNYCVECDPYCVNRECGNNHCGGSCGECPDGYQCISHHCKPIPGTGTEPVPDTAEDVYIWRDAIEAADPGQTPTDSGKPGKDVRKDQKVVNDAVRDITGHRDTQAVDAVGPDTNTKSSGGGCSTGPGPASGIWLILLSLLTLRLRRRQGE